MIPTISSIDFPILNMASPRPLYSVSAPATISVSASGASKGGSSSFPIKPIRATDKSHRLADGNPVAAGHNH